MSLGANLHIPREKIPKFCEKNQIRKLSIFGSALRKDFRLESNVDVLVEFEADARVGLIRLVGIEIELGEILGRKVDLNTPGFLSKYFRDKVLSGVVVQYDAN